MKRRIGSLLGGRPVASHVMSNALPAHVRGHDRRRRCVHRAPPRVRGDAGDRPRHLGPTGRPRHRPGGAAPGGGARRHVHRHGRQLRPGRERGAHRRGAAPVPRRRGRRDQGRAAAARARPVAPRRPPGAPAGRLRGQPRSPGRRPHRPLPAPPARSGGAVRGVGRHARGAPRRGQGGAHRPLERRRRPARPGPRAHPDRVGPEPLQPHRPQLRRRARPLRGARHRVHPVCAGRWAGPPRRRCRAGGRSPARRQPGAGRDRMAPGPLTRRCSRSRAPGRSPTWRRTSPPPHSSSAPTISSSLG